jgi:hypothetical protein
MAGEWFHRVEVTVEGFRGAEVTGEGFRGAKEAVERFRGSFRTSTGRFGVFEVNRVFKALHQCWDYNNIK